MREPAYWSKLAPSLHVNDAGWMAQLSAFDLPQVALQELSGLLKDEGYFALPPQAWALPIAEMADLVTRLHEAGIPLPFCFVYDEFWALYLRMHSVIGGLLGPDYKRLPDFWAWLIDPQASQSGWRPHRDKDYRSLNDDGTPKSLTVWIPLSEATPLNGCIYVVPADRDPTYGTPEDTVWRFEQADVRALPALPGAVLCWNQALLHWGSRASSRGTAPRISVAMEFQRGDVPPYNLPLLSPLTVPDLSLRLRLVSQQILQYQHMYPLSDAIAHAAKAMLAE